jgi:hypothetical protein
MRAWRSLRTFELLASQPNRTKGGVTKDSTVLKAFHDSFRTEDSGRVVSVPKKENITLPTN